jgi:glycosyltransferase involved in cell wall biosynthesis
MAMIGQLFFRVQDRGGEAFARYLATALEERNHTVTNVGYVHGVGELGAVTKGWTVLWEGPPTPLSVIRASVRLFRWLRHERPDAIISHTQVASLIGLPIALLCGVPVRVCLHHQPHGRDLGWPFYVSDALWGTMGIYTDIVLVSDLALDQVDRFPQRYRRRVRLIRNEVPVRELPPGGRARDQICNGTEHPVFCFVGAISQKKGALVAARAIAAHSEAHLIMVGKPSDEYEDVVALAAEADDRIHVLGHVEPDEMPSILAASDCLLFPSVAENRSLAVLEARSAGLRIIASDIRGNRDILGESGSYVPVGDQAGWNQAVVEAVETMSDVRSEPSLDGSPFTELVDTYEEIITRR